jgi:hypothetical protein
MATAEATYKPRATISECANAQAYSQPGVLQLQVSGLVKALAFASRIAITHDLLIRLRHLVVSVDSRSVTIPTVQNRARQAIHAIAKGAQPAHRRPEHAVHPLRQATDTLPDGLASSHREGAHCYQMLSGSHKPRHTPSEATQTPAITLGSEGREIPSQTLSPSDPCPPPYYELIQFSSSK